MRIDFYLLPSSQPDIRWLTACRLIEKAYFKGHQVFVYANNQQEAETLDELLWTFREDSFVPHNLQGEGPQPPPPVQIGWEQEPRGFHDILINCSDNIPDFYHKFKRLIEIVPDEEETKAISRAHFRRYRQMGHDLHTHQL